jgi:hypothetical protein
VITLTPGIIPDDATPEVDEDSANPGGVAYFPWVEITLAASEQDLIRGAPITIASRNPRRWIATADLGAQFNNEFTIQVVASPVVCRLFDFRRVGGVYIPIPWTRGTRETAANALAFKISGLNGQATVSLPGIDDLRDVIG